MKVANLVRNILTSRKAWLSKLLDPRRDIDTECGHPDTVTVQDYKRMFTRGDVANRIVCLYPEETWCNDPEVYETEDDNETDFEQSWKELLTKLPVYSYLQRADMLSGIGRYGVVLLGIGDGIPLSEPVNGMDLIGVGTSTINTLLYLRPLDETLVTISTLENDATNPRYGLPVLYNVTFSDSHLGTDNGPVNTTSVSVHWSRIIHIADNRTNSEIYGCPRLEKVVNRLLDLKKIAGGSGEMFWKGGFPGISLESHPSIDEEVDFDKEATKEQIEAYMNGLQRYIATIGMTAKSLSVNVADPSPHVELQLKLIATAIGVPWRVLIGSEAAELASSQDTKSWNKRISRRRQDYVNPFLIRPFVDRLIQIGVLPPPGEEGYQIAWTDLNTPSDEERASVAEKQSNALSKYVQGGVDVLIPPFHYLTLVLGMEEDEANSIIEAAGERMDQVEEDNVDNEDDGDLSPPAVRGGRPGSPSDQ